MFEIEIETKIAQYKKIINVLYEFPAFVIYKCHFVVR